MSKLHNTYRLLVTGPGDRETEYELISGSLTVGRDVSCDVVMPSSKVSRRHASFYIREDGLLMVRDLRSANGVRLNGRLISSEHFIEQEDEVRIGPFRIRARKVVSEKTDPRQMLPSPADFRRDDCGQIMLGQLVCISGDYKGETYILQESETWIGRDDENHISLKANSISRRHATITRTERGYQLSDLGSGNGTYVNRQRILETELNDGDILRLGDLTFEFFNRALEGHPGKQAHNGQSPTPARKKLRLFLVGATSFIIIFGISIWILLIRSKNRQTPADNPIATQPWDQREAFTQFEKKIEVLLQQGRNHMKAFEWDKAISSFEQALKQDPINKQAPALLRKSQMETKVRKLFEDCKVRIDLGQHEKANETCSLIPRESQYAGRVKYKLKKIRARLAQKYRMIAGGYCNSGRFKRCYEFACKLLQIDPANRKGRELLKRAGKYLSRSRRNCRAPKMKLGAGLSEMARERRIAIKAAIPEPWLNRAVIAYAEGKRKKAQKLFKKLFNNRKLKRLHFRAREMLESENIVDRQFKKGMSAASRGNTKAAHNAWRLALREDRKIVPAGVTSEFRTRIAQMLARAYYRSGSDCFQKDDLAGAYQMWAEARKQDPGYQPVLKALFDLEVKARNLLKEAHSLERIGSRRALSHWKLVRSITAPTSATNREAQRMLSRYQKK